MGWSPAFSRRARDLPASVLLREREQLPILLGLDIVFSVDEVAVEGEFAYALTRSKGSQTINATGEISPEENRELFTFAKENGGWKIARYMFNKMS